MRCRNVLVGLLLVISSTGLAAGKYGESALCVDVLDGYGPYCRLQGCEAPNLGKNRGLCCTAEKCFKEKLQPGEQMCCTGEKVIKMAVGPNQRLVCGQRMYWVLDNVGPKDDACCVSELNTGDDWKEVRGGPKDPARIEFVPGKPCAILRNRNSLKNERIGCTASNVVFAEIGPSYDMACNNERCVRTEVEYPETDRLACRRFNGMMHLKSSDLSPVPPEFQPLDGVDLLSNHARRCGIVVGRN